jgi:hypothetical protein
MNHLNTTLTSTQTYLSGDVYGWGHVTEGQSHGEVWGEGGRIVSSTFVHTYHEHRDEVSGRNSQSLIYPFIPSFFLSLPH